MVFQRCSHTGNTDPAEEGLGLVLAEASRALTVLGLSDIYISQYELDGHRALRVERDQSLGLCLCPDTFGQLEKLEGLQTKGED